MPHRPASVAAILAAAVMLGAPLAAQVPDAPLAVPFRQFTLPNGLTVILHRDTSVPVVTVNTWYHVGSASEAPGRTGFAHLFEHLMFEGSANVPEGQIDVLLEGAGGGTNGFTTNDYTVYYIDVPSNALDLALYLDSDRMGYLLEAITPEVLDGQRAVVMNERRQSYENAPYGESYLLLDELLWPEGHPYRWPVIGSMEDLAAASHDDVVAFFEQYYAPNNASLVVAGDIDLDAAQALVEKWYAEIPRGAPVETVAAPLPRLDGVIEAQTSDRVSLPKLYLAWVAPPEYAPAGAALDMVASVLAGGKNSRLYRRLVYDTQMAQDVTAYQDARRLGSAFVIEVVARPGVAVEDVRRAVDEELDALRREAPTAREITRVRNEIEASFYRQMETVGGGYRGKGNQLNAYFFAGASPDYFAEDLARYAAVDPSDVQAALATWLPADRRVELVVTPEVQP
jgi:zinc protease